MHVGSLLIAGLALAGMPAIDRGTALVVLGTIESTDESGPFVVAEVRPTEFLRGERRERLSVRFPSTTDDPELVGMHAALFLEPRGEELWVADGRAGLVTSREPFLPAGIDLLRFALAAEPRPARVKGAPLTLPGPGISVPVRVRTVDPEYPDLARRAGGQGRVMVSAVVGADGRLSDFRLLKAPFSGLGLEAAVLRALSQWEFEPARKDGQPVAVYMTLVVDFSLGNAPLSKDAGVPRAPAIAEALAAMVPGLAPAPAPVPESEVREIHAALSRLAEARRQHDLATCVGLLHPDYVAAFRANLLIWAQREDSAEGLRAAFGTSSVQVLESKSAEELWRTFALAAPELASALIEPDADAAPPTVVAEGEELRRVTTKGGPVLIFKRDGTSWKLLPNDRGLPWDWLLRDRLKPPDR